MSMFGNPLNTNQVVGKQNSAGAANPEEAPPTSPHDVPQIISLESLGYPSAVQRSERGPSPELRPDRVQSYAKVVLLQLSPQLNDPLTLEFCCAIAGLQRERYQKLEAAHQQSLEKYTERDSSLRGKIVNAFEFGQDVFHRGRGILNAINLGASMLRGPAAAHLTKPDIRDVSVPIQEVITSLGDRIREDALRQVGCQSGLFVIDEGPTDTVRIKDEEILSWLCRLADETASRA